MEQSEQVTNTNPGYWPSVGIAALIFGFIYFIISLIGGYMTINAEPTGSMFGSISQAVTGVAGCLIAAFGGMLAVWHYSRTYGITLKMGKGALIGLYVGIGIAVIMTLLSQIWELIDPSYTNRLMESMIANYEAIEGMPEAQRQQVIDGVYSQFQESSTLWGIIKGMLFVAVPVGILNLLTGMLGVSMFAREKESA